MDQQAKEICIFCEQTSDEVPLVPFKFKGGEYHICSQHLPIFIHKPHELVEKLPGFKDVEQG